MRPIVHQYDQGKFDFAAAFREIYRVDDLSTLHADSPMEVLTWQTDQATVFHRQFYAAFDEHIRSRYRGFVAAVAPKVLGTGEFCFQRVPTVRVHLPGNLAVGEFHTDGDYNHKQREVNFWVPVTPTWGSNSVWIEQELGQHDYAPVSLAPGEMIVFDAVNWSHGNKINETGACRVSFDFRCIRLSEYEETGLRSVDAGKGMWIGDYFDVLTEQELAGAGGTQAA
jgi:ectoine hydroxylase-related dioxygenase (phytanoyl-CoA dioxygenase family)